MIFETLPIIALGLAAVAVSWCMPAAHAQNGVAAFTALALIVVAPATAAIMLASIVGVHQVMARTQAPDRATFVTVSAIAVLAAVLLQSREAGAVLGVQWLLVGLAYSTLRHIHVLVEWRLGRITAPTLGAYCRYHLLLPVIVAGPIHRLPHFERQCRRRRFAAAELFAGAERVLLGFAFALIVGEYLIGTKVASLWGPSPSGFMRAWLVSAIGWVRIYVTFSGLTHVALGLCLMMGLRLEENFDRPWRARNLAEFWTRWHMTLSHWCRDYIYMPVAVSLRSPVAGVLCAMLVLGLWHQSSWYYVLWGAYQAAGIVLARLLQKAGERVGYSRLPQGMRSVLAPVAILAWVSSARAVLLALGFPPRP